MGCCLSSSNRDPKHHQNASNHHYPPPAPAQPVEEERVKEVLFSETSVPRQEICVPILQHKCTQTPLECEIEVNTDLINKQEEEGGGESQVQASQLSEICSSVNSETLSSMATTTTTTTIVAENREDEAVSKRVSRSPIKVPRKRPHTGDLGGATERASKSPARRGNPPARSGQVSSRPGRGRELSSQVRNTQRSERSRSSEVVMRDSGEGPGRRSRSPATRKTSGLVGSGDRDSPVSRTQRAGDARLLGEAGVENGTVLREQGRNESLDNPLVSMECFIFL